MDGFSFGKRGWIGLGRDRDQQGTTKRRPARATIGLETLEGRVVLSSGSSLVGNVLPLQAATSGTSGSTSALGDGPMGDFGGGMNFQRGPGGRGGPGGSGQGPGGGMQLGGPGGQGGTSSVLGQDARQVNQAFQTFNASIQSAVSTLRQSATTTTGPTTAGISAFNTSVESAVSTLNSSISSALSNLPNTGAALTTTIQGYTATLQSEIESAGTGLANSTNSAVLALKQEIGGDVRTAQQQTSQAIQNDVPTGSITGTTAQTFNKAVASALQTFGQAINTARQTAITNGTTLDSSAVSSAVATLSSSLTAAVAALPSGFTASSANPSSTLTTQLATLQTDLTAITAPTAGSTSSARTFSFAVASALGKDTSAIVQTLNSAINTYNQSLL